jgi:hypothetical protein
VPCDELSRTVDVPRSEKVVDHVRDRALGLVPRRRAAMEGGNQIRLRVLQLAAQERGEEPVVAVPAPAVVERDDEQVRPLHLLELAGGARPFDDRVAQRP